MLFCPRSNREEAPQCRHLHASRQAAPHRVNSVGRILLAVALPGTLLLAAGPAVAATSAPAPNSSAMSSTAVSPAASVAGTQVYVYWSYWSAGSSGGWTFATVGSASITPPDGSVEGWRYGAGEGAGPSQPPSVAPDFGAVCAGITAVTGKKRVAVVIDSGTAGVATTATPPAVVTKCAQVDVTANGTQVLNAVTQTRMAADGMVCGINGYPATGCGVQVPAGQLNSPAPGAASGTNDPSGSRLPWIIGIIVIVIIGLGAWLVSRQQRK